MAVGVAAVGVGMALVDRPGDRDEELIGFPAPSDDDEPTGPPPSRPVVTVTVATATTTPLPTVEVTVPVTSGPPATTAAADDRAPGGDESNGGDGDEGAGEGPGDAGAVAPAADPMPPVTFEHQWDGTLDGPVWIVVETADAVPRTVVIRWGPWQRTLRHDRAGRTTYVFDKDPTRPGEHTVPTTVTVTPGGSVGLVFGKGSPPDGAIPVDDGWEPAPAPRSREPASRKPGR